MSVIEKSEVLSLVAGSGLPRRRALAQLGLAKSTYYRWLKQLSEGRLKDRKGSSPVPWNKLSLDELVPRIKELKKRQNELGIRWV